MEDGYLRILLEMFTQEEQTMQYSHTEVAGEIRGKAWPDLNTVVEYYVDQKYRKLTMKLNPYKDTDSLSWGLVKVYVDDKLTATSDVIKQKTDKAIEFNVDITGAKYIKIEPYVRESADYLGGVRYSTGGIILWDVKLWK